MTGLEHLDQGENLQRLRQVEHFAERLRQCDSLVECWGKVAAIEPAALHISGLSKAVSIGDLLDVHGSAGPSLAEVIAVRPQTVVAKLFENNLAVALDAEVRARGPLRIATGVAWKGRVVSATGEALDDLGPLPRGPSSLSVSAAPPRALQRVPLERKLTTGIKAIDLFTPLCHGQRVGIFAGSGVGKSTLLAMLARSTAFDSAVIALVGERGREVNEFIHEVLGAALSKSVVVVATGDESASKRRLAPLTATSIAESFRDAGERVLLIMDSVTRFAHAARELALSAGEPPVARGYPPSIFSALPQLLERSGAGAQGAGSITGIYSVLVDGDNHNDPVADTIRGTLDGHIVLDRQIAASGRYPAIDLLGSVSRLAHKCRTPQEQQAVHDMRRLISRFEETKDLRALGGYQPGNDAELDRALQVVPKIYAALAQDASSPLCPDAFAELARLLK